MNNQNNKNINNYNSPLISLWRKWRVMDSLFKYYEDEARFKNKINMNVIKFIDDVVNFPDRDGTVNDSIDHLFCAGYCYYFANMLKIAFGGKVCWVEGRGHIVWADCDNDCTLDELQCAIAYDITGVYMDYERLWPIEYLGSAVIDYMHNGADFHLNQRFKDWCDFLGVTESYAVSVIWGVIELDVIMKCYNTGWNYVETAYQQWIAHTAEFQRIIRSIKAESGKLTKSMHGGIDAFLKEDGVKVITAFKAGKINEEN